VVAWFLLDGPPGTGKTTRVIQQFIKAARKYGPKQVAACTYTKSAAEELRLRAASALGISGGSEVLKKEIPWVGTTHSLSFKIIGVAPNQVVDNSNIQEFATSIGRRDNVRLGFDPADMEDGGWRSTDVSEMSVILKAHSTARNRCCAIRNVLDDLVLPSQRMAFPATYVESVAKKYEEWKRDTKHLDYEDMLEIAAEHRLPVKVLLFDEAQDASPLMWDLIDRWAEGCKVALASGDAFQSIFSFMGAVPELFLNHPGKWIHLAHSHRCPGGTGPFARQILRAAGYTQENEWDGTGNGARDAEESTFYLARTHNLVLRTQAELMEQGTPFVNIRGGYSPWTSPTAEAYRLISRLQRGALIQSALLPTVVKGLTGLERGVKTAVDREARDPSPVDSEDVERLLRIPLSQVSYKGSEIVRYLRNVERVHGVRALTAQPTVMVGTIHAAKGRQAKHVNLIADWDYLPARVAATPGDGARREACVGYVAATRHQGDLNILEKGWSETFRFPRRG
jgi:superfamily I DNA/RNA helicase